MKKSTLSVKRLIIILCNLIVGVLIQSCSSEPSFEQASSDVGNLLSNLNIVNAQSIYYREASSRMGEGCYYKLDTSGKEVKLQISNSQSITTDVGINWVLNVSQRYLFVHPSPWDVGDAIGLDEYGQGDDIWRAINVICVADKLSGKLYRIPYLPLGRFDDDTAPGIQDANSRVVYERNGLIYIIGDPTTTGGLYSQIYVFNPDDLTINELLPEGQELSWIEIDDEGFVGYWGGYHSTYKVKCPGGSIIVMPDNTFMIGGHFYSIIDQSVYKWLNEGDNSMTKTEICSIPDDLYMYYGRLIDELTDNIVFYNYTFDGHKFTKLENEIPYRIMEGASNFNAPNIYETNEAWYSIDKNNLLKLNKRTYEVTSIPLSEYQILELTSDLSSSSLSFIGIRYSDSVKVFGKILRDNSFDVESSVQANYNIYNLIPLS